MRIFNSVPVMFLITGMLLTLPGCTWQQQADDSDDNVYITNEQEGIWVIGTGKVTVTPDIATLSLGVETQEPSVAQAQIEATQAMNNIISVLKTQGVADKDIQTQRYSIQQVTRYDQTTQQQEFVGFMVDNIVVAKIRNLDNVGKIIDAAAQAGGNLTRINNVSFSVEDPTQYYDEARTKAVQDAQNTANQLASLNRVTIGQAIYISESGQSSPPLVSTSATVPAPSPTPETPISPGQLEVTITVQVAYEIVK